MIYYYIDTRSASRVGRCGEALIATPLFKYSIATPQSD